MSSEHSHEPFPPGGELTPEEQERMNAERAAYEEQLARVSSVDMALQAAVSLLGVGGRRLGLVPGSEAQRDLEQVRDAIDGVRGLMPILERRIPNELGPLRDALSQLQMAYAQQAQAEPPVSSENTVKPQGSERPAEAPASGGAAREPAPAEANQPGAGPAESSGRLWVPGR